MKKGYDIIVVARVKSRYATFQEIEKSVLSLMEKLSILNPSPKSGRGSSNEVAVI